MSDAVWRSNIFKSCRPGDAVAVCRLISDRMVSGVHVDAGPDPSFSAYTEDTICTEQSFCPGYLYDYCRNYCFYGDYFYQKCSCFWVDEITDQVFWIFICCSAIIYAADYGSQNIISEKIS